MIAGNTLCFDGGAFDVISISNPSGEYLMQIGKRRAAKGARRGGGRIYVVGSFHIRFRDERSRRLRVSVGCVRRPRRLHRATTSRQVSR
ncbi:hypothetical protein EVAR_64104_1 [Eumeta japonica]|uniref:Uncharacterized protein n=1 Tax=Eumeta variegata TaxID=151549 RepID=A0A4C1ZKB7_EUMVA|nr:hypothetical protein EVAR_64104_1 [Eumeta japonica]